MKRCNRCHHEYTFEPCPFCADVGRRTSSDDTATMPAVSIPDFTSPAVDTGSAPDTSTPDFSGGGGDGGGGGASSDF